MHMMAAPVKGDSGVTDFLFFIVTAWAVKIVQMFTHLPSPSVNMTCQLHII